MPQVWNCLYRTNSERDQIKTEEERALKGAAIQVKWRQSCGMGLLELSCIPCLPVAEANAFQPSQFGFQSYRETGKGAGNKEVKTTRLTSSPTLWSWLLGKPPMVFAASWLIPDSGKNKCLLVLCFVSALAAFLEAQLFPRPQSAILEQDPLTSYWRTELESHPPQFMLQRQLLFQLFL